MSDIDQNLDTRLSAYLDGEMTEDQSAEIEAVIARDEAAAARLSALALARSDFETSANDIDGMPMSAGLSTLLERLEEERNTESRAGNVIEFPLWKRASEFMQDHRAVAASVAVAAGAMTLQTAIPAQVASVNGLDGSGTIYADSDLGRVLEASASGKAVDLEDGLAATPRFTFASGDAFCRVVDVESAATDGRLVACRTETAWRVAIATFGEPAGGSADAPYRTASAAGSQSIEAFLDAAMSDAPLSVDAETKLLKSGWQTPATMKE